MASALNDYGAPDVHSQVSIATFISLISIHKAASLGEGPHSESEVGGVRRATRRHVTVDPLTTHIFFQHNTWDVRGESVFRHRGRGHNVALSTERCKKLSRHPDSQRMTIRLSIATFISLISVHQSYCLVVIVLLSRVIVYVSLSLSSSVSLSRMRMYLTQRFSLEKAHTRGSVTLSPDLIIGAISQWRSLT